MPNRKKPSVGFEDKPLETVATDFEAKLAKTVRVILKLNHSQTVAIGFEAQTDEKPSPPVLRPNRQKPSEWF
jgi:hypothetical protein